jgi:hypothetical protein
MITTRLRMRRVAASALSLAVAGLVGTGAAHPRPDPAAADATRRPVGKNVFFEVQGGQRRVVVAAAVCLREGQLEGLLTRKGTKEHEYILAADVDARHVHAALLAAGAKPGSPVRFEPRYAPASGTPIRISLRYQKDGKPVTEPARRWVRTAADKKELDQDWVFAGSRLLPDPDDPKKPPIYLANQGDLVCLVNMETAMLDLPVRSPKKLDERVFVADPDHVPPLGTAVEIILEPVPEKKGEGQ